MSQRYRLEHFLGGLLVSIFILTLVFVKFAEAQDLNVQIKELAYSPSWIKLLQYKKKSDHQYVSDVQSQVFFISPLGLKNPEAELTATIDELTQKNSSSWGAMKIPAACAFPARAKFIEKNFNLKLPKVTCADLDEWVHRINADSVSIVYASSYVGNPASILGHTFLRFYNSKLETEQPDISLLSYAAGFLAFPNPNDSQALYVLKGISGRYPGFYSLEPFYMKVGLYNNSESRDLHEQKLVLSREQVDFMLLNLWEVLFNAQFKYYFFDENCSYRILTLIEGTRPELNIVENLSSIVLPAETIRALIDKDAAEENSRFRPSIKKRIQIKFDQFSKSDQLEFLKFRNEKIYGQVSAPILDALIDDWTLINYKSNDKLLTADREKMESVFTARAQLSDVSKQPTHLAADQARPPFKGHPASLIAYSLGYLNNTNGNLKDQATLGIMGQMGNHSLWQNSDGYDPYSAIEYAHFELTYSLPANRLLYWNFKFAEVNSVTPLTSLEKKFSWLIAAQIESQCAICKEPESTNINLKGGYGGSFKFKSLMFKFLPALDLSYGEKHDGTIAMGTLSGLQWDHPTLRISALWQYFWFERHAASQIDLTLNPSKNDRFHFEFTSLFRDSREIENKVSAIINF